jgi:DNA-binding response OmpR family regulator
MKKILVVEDDADILEMKFVLEKEGYQMFEYASGLEVPEAVEKYQPDLILVDIRLPGKTGTEVCKEL